MKKTILTGILCLMFAAFATSCTPTEYDLFSNIVGTVVDKESGEPLGQVAVTLAGGSFNTYTGSDGCFSFNNIEAGEYKVWVQKDGYRANNKSVVAPSGETINVSITMEKKLLVSAKTF